MTTDYETGSGHFDDDLFVGADNELDYELSLTDSLLMDPRIVLAQELTRKTKNLPGRLKSVFEEGRSDFDEDRLSTIGWVAAASVTQTLSRLRFSAVAVPVATTRVLESSGSNTRAAMAGAAVFGAWNYWVGETVGKSLDKTPSIVEAFGEEFPGALDFLDTTAGNDVELSEKSNVFERVKKIGKRSLQGVGLGPTLFVGTEMARSGSVSKARRVNAEVSLGASVVVGGVAKGVLEGVEHLARNGRPELAQDILGVASSGKFWQGVAVLLMYSDYSAKRKENAESQAQESVVES